ncbi:type IV secretion system protein VirB5 [Variovorax sp. SG517]|uniref:type IV secretion system protein n=1 Tax=Variovorax sp. SG517 TaxID=2587117 RepID=UPI00159E00C6|nr:type IV secretion system protein [Variovorax sp. SG517]NVM92986.1 type IV secretion system protein VirB5 [Variovorax sp. SG517]
MHRHAIALLLAIATFAVPLHAKAGIPVIDVTAIANLIQQVMYWQQQISGMQKQLDQVKATKEQLAQTHGAMTGTRGMEQLLPTSNSARNYLPASYDELLRTQEGSSGSYAGLSTQVQSILKANSILTGTQMEALGPELRQIVDQGRQSAALLHGMTQSAYQNTSQRFAALQQLVNGIATAQDPKAIQDLQARIQAEQTMLTNEQTKLQSLYHMAMAEEATQRQRTREQVIAGHGRFSTRFLPRP